MSIMGDIRDWYEALTPTEQTAWLDKQSLKMRVAFMPDTQRNAFLASLDAGTLALCERGEWFWEARPSQVPPDGDFFVILALCGRGWGKSRSGSEWVVDRALRYPRDVSGFPTTHLVVAESLEDAKTTCAEGDSGILRVLRRLGWADGIDFKYTRTPRPRITLLREGWEGVLIRFDSADNADVGRGLNLFTLWADELAMWKNSYESWYEGLLPALRSSVPGARPQAFVTTTPKRGVALIKEWLAKEDGSVHLIRGSMFENIANLDEHTLAALRDRYSGTRLGQQELEGVFFDDDGGMLFSEQNLNLTRVHKLPDQGISAKVVGVDPALTGDVETDEMGVIAVGRSHDNHLYVLEDASKHLAGKEAARHAWTVFARHGADILVVEDNLGKKWMTDYLKEVYQEMVEEGVFPEHTTPPLDTVHSQEGKKLRAETTALRFEQGRAHMVGEFPDLEKQMVGFDPLSTKESPDRLDALVHACRKLIEGEKRKVRIFSPRNHRRNP